MVKSPKFPSCINLLSLSAAVSSSKPPPLGGGLLLPPLHRWISNVDAKHSPALRLVGIFGQSKLNGSVVGGEKTNPPFQKMCARQNWIMNPPGFGVKCKFQLNALKFHVMEISTFLEQPETGQGPVAAPTQNWWFLFCLSGLP